MNMRFERKTSIGTKHLKLSSSIPQYLALLQTISSSVAAMSKQSFPWRWTVKATHKYSSTAYFSVEWEISVCWLCHFAFVVHWTTDWRGIYTIYAHKRCQTFHFKASLASFLIWGFNIQMSDLNLLLSNTLIKPAHSKISALRPAPS